MNTALKVICAWCTVVIVDGPAFPVSHGICAKCAKKVVE